MISVLIPVYNRQVTTLVNTLFEQLERAQVRYQIIVLDDASTDPTIKETNHKLYELMNVSYMELSENAGRSKIRNKLAKLASYENLLFLDNDVSIVSEDFISKYLAEAHHDLVCGGITYTQVAPAMSHRLHWQIGRSREAQSASVRNKKSPPTLLSANFMVKAALAQKFPFEEFVEGYGYEDVSFAHVLSKAGKTIYHIDNAVRHDGIERNEVFLQKSAKALENLKVLKSGGKLETTKLLKYAQYVQRIPLAASVVKWLGPYMEKKLLSGRFLNVYFDIWKLGKVL